MSFLNATKEKTEAKANDYLQYFSNEPKAKKEVENTKSMVNTWYDLATDFYEYGWGESFHFFSSAKGLSFKDAMAKQEIHLAELTNPKPGETVVDFGCGVGGPGRAVAKHFNVKVLGVNNNQYQLQRAAILTKKANLSDLCSYHLGDFTKLDLTSDTYDKAFIMEATCHALVRAHVYAEAFRILKPGGILATQEWVFTDKYDAENPEHQKIMKDIEEGNGLAPLVPPKTVLNSLKEVGFEIVQADDMSLTSEVPWEKPLEPGWSNLRATPLGRTMTHYMLTCMEKVGLAPKGSVKVHATLLLGADSLVRGAKAGIFTPLYVVSARKPNIK